MARFRNSEHATISDMVRGHEDKIPKHGGRPVCLSWALKGECSGACRRAEQHARYSCTTIQNLHEFMDTCGVANPQP